MTDSPQFWRKGCNNALDQIRHLMNCFNQRVCLNNLRLAECYVKSELHFLVYFSVNGIDKEGRRLPSAERVCRLA